MQPPGKKRTRKRVDRSAVICVAFVLFRKDPTRKTNTAKFARARISSWRETYKSPSSSGCVKTPSSSLSVKSWNFLVCSVNKERTFVTRLMICTYVSPSSSDCRILLRGSPATVRWAPNFALLSVRTSGSTWGTRGASATKTKNNISISVLSSCSYDPLRMQCLEAKGKSQENGNEENLRDFSGYRCFAHQLYLSHETRTIKTQDKRYDTFTK